MRFDSARLLAKRSNLQFQDVVAISIGAVGIELVVFGLKALRFFGQNALLRIELVEVVWSAEWHRPTVYAWDSNREPGELSDDRILCVIRASGAVPVPAGRSP